MWRSRPTHFLAGLLLLPAFAVAACVLVAAAPPPAKDKPAERKGDEAPAAAPAPRLVASASVASVKSVETLAKELSLADVLPLSAASIEEQIPFIGPGGLASDRPLGVQFRLTPDTDLERAMTIILPVNPGKAELKTFVERGAQPMPGREDMVKLGPVGFRRTRDQFLFGQFPEAVAAVEEDALTSLYKKDPATVAHVDVDIAAMRETVPERYEAFFADLSADVDPGAAADSGRRAGREFAADAMRRLDRLSLSASRGEDGGVRLQVSIAPFTAKPPAAPAAEKAFAVPAFPPGTVARADFRFAPAQALSPLTSAMVDSMIRDAEKHGATDEEKQLTKMLVASANKLLLGGESASLGVEKVGEHVVLYWVTRRTPGDAKLDVGQEMKSIAARDAELVKIGRQDGALKFESYDSDAVAGLRVSRLALENRNNKDTDPWYVDAVMRGDQVFMAFANDDGRFLERLLAEGLKPEPQVPPAAAASLASGWLDLAALARSGLLGEAEGDLLDGLKRAKKDQRVNWTASPAGGALRIDVRIPKSLLENTPKLIEFLSR